MRPDIGPQLMQHYKMLISVAVRMCKNRDRAEDMVQEAFLRALDKQHTFDGRNLAAWLVMIMKNEYRTELRRNWRMVEDPDDLISQTVPCKDDQLEKLIAKELLHDIAGLPIAFRDPLFLIAVDGASYEETAIECMIQEGTVKSRVHRARCMIKGESAA